MTEDLDDKIAKCDEIHRRINVITGSLFECLTNLACIEPEYFRRERLILRDRFRVLYEGDELPPAISAAVEPPIPPLPPVPASVELDRKKPMFVWMRTPRGLSPEIWPGGEGPIPNNKRGFIKAWNIELIDGASPSLDELAKTYRLTTDEINKAMAQVA